MSDMLTRIRLPGSPCGWGLMEWGEQSAADMIAQLRAHAAHLRQQAETIEAAADAEFQIDVIRGVHAQHHIREIQSAIRSSFKEGADGS